MPADTLTTYIDDHTALSVFIHTLDVETHSLLVGPRWEAVVNDVRERLQQIAREERGRRGK